MRVQRGGDRREDVDRLHERVVDAPELLSGKLHEQRLERDVDEVAARDVPARRPRAEAHAVIGRDDDERPVVEARRAQAPQDEPEGVVGVTELEKEALLGLLREPVVVPPGSVRRTGDDANVTAVALARREVEPRHVWQQRVDEVERRLPLRP